MPIIFDVVSEGRWRKMTWITEKVAAVKRTQAGLSMRQRHAGSRVSERRSGTTDGGCSCVKLAKRGRETCVAARWEWKTARQRVHAGEGRVCKKNVICAAQVMDCAKLLKRRRTGL